MGRAHFDAMLKSAQQQWIRAMPAISGLAAASPLLGPYCKGVQRCANLAIDLNELDIEFVANMNSLLADGKIWVYETLSNGRRSRTRDQHVFDAILDPLPEVVDAANNVGIF